MFSAWGILHKFMQNPSPLLGVGIVHKCRKRSQFYPFFIDWIHITFAIFLVLFKFFSKYIVVNSAIMVYKYSASYSLNAYTNESIRMVIDRVQRNRCLWDKKCREYSMSNQKKRDYTRSLIKNYLPMEFVINKASFLGNLARR